MENCFEFTNFQMTKGIIFISANEYIIRRYFFREPASGISTKISTNKK